MLNTMFDEKAGFEFKEIEYNNKLLLIISLFVFMFSCFNNRIDKEGTENRFSARKLFLIRSLLVSLSLLYQQEATVRSRVALSAATVHFHVLL